MKTLTFLFLALVIGSESFAFKEYYSLRKSIRALGMGGAFYGLSDDEYALFYNPAGLSLYRGKTQVMLGIDGAIAGETITALNSMQGFKGSSAGTIVNTLNQFENNPIYASGGVMPYFLHKNLAVGLLIADTKVQMAILGANFDTSVDVTAISDSGLVVGYSHPLFLDNLNLGMNLKGVLRAGGKKELSVLDLAQGTGLSFDPQSLGGVGAGVDCDLGATYEFSGIPYTVTNHAALVFSNLLASQLTMVRLYGAPPTLSRMVSLGFHSVFPGYRWIDNFHFLLDVAEFGLGGENDPDFGARIGAFWKHLNFGLEVPIHRWLILRTGVHQGYFTAGIGISTSLVKLDLATYEEDLDLSVNRLSSRRYALRLAIGWGNSTSPAQTEPLYLSRAKELSSQRNKRPSQEGNAIVSPADPKTPDPAEGAKAVPSSEKEMVKPENAQP